MNTIWIDNARIIAILGVILLHVTGAVPKTQTSDEWIIQSFTILSKWCVPVFVILSGASLLLRNQKEEIISFYRKRTTRVVIPTLFWSALLIVQAHLNAIRIEGKSSILNLVLELISGRLYYHMWFLYMIIGIYILTPFIRMTLKELNEKEAIVLIGVVFTISSLNKLISAIFSQKDYFFMNWSLSYLPYYIFGYYVIRYPKNYNIYLCVAASAFFAASALMSITNFEESYLISYFQDFLSIPLIGLSICLVYLFQKINKPLIGNFALNRKCADATLGIYMIHIIVIGFLAKRNLILNFIHPTITISVYTVLIFILSLIITLAIKQIPFLKFTV